ncbi:amino acid ABC transporter substrate-binding protein, partial [Burkholderia pseudomallei]
MEAVSRRNRGRHRNGVASVRIRAPNAGLSAHREMPLPPGKTVVNNHYFHKNYLAKLDRVFVKEMTTMKLLNAQRMFPALRSFAGGAIAPEKGTQAKNKE